jgi:hypothetical protein
MMVVRRAASGPTRRRPHGILIGRVQRDRKKVGLRKKLGSSGYPISDDLLNQEQWQGEEALCHK